MGLSALTSHAKGKKHIQTVQDIRVSQPIFKHITTKNDATEKLSAKCNNEPSDQNQNSNFVECSNNCNTEYHNTDTPKDLRPTQPVF